MKLDRTVKDQKVFVKLGSVMEVQRAYLQMLANHKAGVDSGNPNWLLAERIRAFGSIIGTLELPIETK